ncbi:methyl-accepting chemotaxis protein [Enterobacteriaceae bacterium H20N1]|uniref:Methyl-accepting chemotaxis protein n=1 Tax=Dryocola boscaweniae TaxID=2925397 RepID=A0A9X2W9Y4_9ENTR|nr:methyl-accepting chemotaxis protein [Dryocola boscaweniae]MCT4703823.1 methyl-accepting chemotaxis protein [Dryocola boscaweniae]MCT4720991.1 methyl-accepting chemotaxis protein [Dryocola boscaweniae]
MNLSQILTSWKASRSFGLLSGFICVITLFCVLQIMSTLLLSTILRDTQRDVLASDRRHEQQVFMDKARSSLLMASDLLNRAGIYFLQDKETGSVGSWNSLMDESQAALKTSLADFDRYQQLRSTNSQQEQQHSEALVSSYKLFFDGLKEQADGLAQSSSIDAFFAVPIQAFQSDFNDRYASFQNENERRTLDASGSLLNSLSQAQNMFIAALGVLALVAVGVWLAVTRWVIKPLKGVIAHIDILAAGDLSCLPPAQTHVNREVNQLRGSVVAMQQGLRHLVQEVRDAAATMAQNINQLAEGNQKLFSQSAQQEQELQGVTSHITELGSRVKENSDYAELANLRADEAREIAAGGDQMMQTVNLSMQDIVAQSSEMRGIVAMIDGVAFQTNILALNAAIEAAHAGNHGRGFAVVAKEVGLLGQKSSQSTRNIQALIGNSMQGIEQGSDAVTVLEANLQKVIDVVNKLSGLLSEISAATLNQGESVHHVTKRIATLNQVANQTNQLIRETSRSSRLLRDESSRLESAVARFHLPAEQSYTL